ncbi:hypothetical protein J6590_071775 [Homalodisca vitripennis]|nr:hypothetical protein J6590_071775 [Homalodisca vitripennis]
MALRFHNHNGLAFPETFNFVRGGLSVIQGSACSTARPHSYLAISRDSRQVLYPECLGRASPDTSRPQGSARHQQFRTGFCLSASHIAEHLFVHGVYRLRKVKDSVETAGGSGMTRSATVAATEQTRLPGGEIIYEYFPNHVVSELT